MSNRTMNGFGHVGDEPGMNIGYPREALGSMQLLLGLRKVQLEG